MVAEQDGFGKWPDSLRVAMERKGMDETALFVALRADGHHAGMGSLAKWMRGKMYYSVRQWFHESLGIPYESLPYKKCLSDGYPEDWPNPSDLLVVGALETIGSQYPQSSTQPGHAERMAHHENRVKNLVDSGRWAMKPKE